MIKLNDKTLSLLGQLNSMSATMPSPQRFIKAYIMKEALLSSAIENIHTTMLDVFTNTLATSEGQEPKSSQDVRLVVNYADALSGALDLMHTKNMPLVSQVFLKAHEILMTTDENSKASPGAYRKQSVRVGNFTPPPANEVPQLISDLEHFINDDTPSGIPLLIKAGLAHAQFEMIHPFLDGNGRIGRLLITLMLCQDEILKTPILYPSYFLKKHQLEYYQKLGRISSHGEFEEWVLFYLQAMFYGAQDAVARAHDIVQLHHQLHQKIASDAEFTKTKETAHIALQHLFELPVINNNALAKIIGKSFNTTQKIIQQLIKAQILQEITAQKRNKLYKFQPYLQILDKEY